MTILMEKDCPVCAAPIRSNAEERHYCEVCGMGIPRQKLFHSVPVGAERAFFCSSGCKSIYARNRGMEGSLND